MQDSFSFTTNADPAALEALYESYKKDPEAVDPSWRQFFAGYEFAQAYLPEQDLGEGSGADKGQAASKPTGQAAAKPSGDRPAGDQGQALRAFLLVDAYRRRGHLEAKTNPVRKRRDHRARLAVSDFGLTDQDLSGPAGLAGTELALPNGATLGQGLERLRQIYLGPIGFEYTHIRDQERLGWLRERIEKYPEYKPSNEQKRRILEKLNEAVVLESFLHTKFVGQKRFSLEGGETTIPALDALITRAGRLGVSEVVIGMAHRGRLNVLANTMGKTYEHIFSEFEGTAKPDLTMGDGDVKYHMGYSSQVTTPEGHTVDLKLCPNPSHLEAVNPVVAGFARAKADYNYGEDLRCVLPVLIHGDAAIAGQGITYEIAQMSALEGYTVGGTLHFVINNQVGFTTDFDDARSSTYCTDIAKTIEAPALHVNGDDPEAVCFAIELAVEYRHAFGADFFIDMVCYRRHGHNESDEPKFTQPSLYKLIGEHPNPREIYARRLTERGEIDAKQADELDAQFRSMLQERLNEVKQQPLPYVYQKLEKNWKELRRSKPEDFDQSPETAITAEVIAKVGKALTDLPEGFTPLRQIERLMAERRRIFLESGPLNWAAAELLAYGSLLEEGHIVRLSGQDVRRGTFSHRHAILRDAQTSEALNSLDQLGAPERLRIYNSLLSEYAVLGYEFGYSMANPGALVIWEAQFGDFANGAQVMIDQFLSSTESKWQRMNGVVCLLPHGYEGQGPEHSNARPERFLQLAAEYNMYVCNVTEPANFFHMLRRQVALPFRKPCILMSPKSLLRAPEAVSPHEAFTSGGFREVIGDPAEPDASRVERVILCSGKLYYELDEQRKTNKLDHVAIIRIEQLHPLPIKQIDAEIARYGEAEVYWVQEEPENMGAWGYILRQLRHYHPEVVARKESASPATGYVKVHIEEQKDIIRRALEMGPREEVEAAPTLEATKEAEAQG